MWTNCAYCGKKLTIIQGQEGFTGYCDNECKTYETTGKPKTALEFIDDDSIYNGIYEHITNEPIIITGGRKELIEVCKKYGVAAKALIKPKSQGRGWEMQQRRFK